MRTGGAAGVADEADQFAPAYRNALLDAGREFGKMTIDRGEIPRMIDADPVAISAIRRRADNDTVGRSVYRRGGRRREIDALMHGQRVKATRRRLEARLGHQPHCNATGRGRVERRTLGAHAAGRLAGAAHRRALADRVGRRRLIERIGAHAETRRDGYGIAGQSHPRRRRGLSLHPPQALHTTRRSTTGREPARRRTLRRAIPSITWLSPEAALPSHSWSRPISTRWIVSQENGPTAYRPV